MRNAGVGRILQFYAAKLAAARLCGRPEEIAAAVQALLRERTAALKAFKQIIGQEQRQRRLAEGANMRTRQAARRRFAAGLRFDFSDMRRAFVPAAGEVRRGRRRRYRHLRRPFRHWRQGFGRGIVPS
jgi:hypothetical protein